LGQSYGSLFLGPGGPGSIWLTYHPTPPSPGNTYPTDVYHPGEWTVGVNMNGSGNSGPLVCSGGGLAGDGEKNGPPEGGPLCIIGLAGDGEKNGPPEGGPLCIIGTTADQGQGRAIRGTAHSFRPELSSPEGNRSRCRHHSNCNSGDDRDNHRRQHVRRARRSKRPGPEQWRWCQSPLR
jgi:hypothetical protein